MSKVWGGALFVDFLEYILEATVVTFEDGVLGGHVQWPTSLESELETTMCKPCDRLVGVVHRKTYSSSLKSNEKPGIYLEIIDCPPGWFGAGFRGEYNLELSFFLCDKVCTAVLIAKGMTTDDDGLFPPWDETGNTFHDNWFAKHGTIQDIPDRPVWRFPHLFQMEFCYQWRWEKWGPLTRASSGVMVAHLMPTLYF